MLNWNIVFFKTLNVHFKCSLTTTFVWNFNEPIWSDHLIWKLKLTFLGGRSLCRSWLLRNDLTIMVVVFLRWSLSEFLLKLELWYILSKLHNFRRRLSTSRLLWSLASYEYVIALFRPPLSEILIIATCTWRHLPWNWE